MNRKSRVVCLSGGNETFLNKYDHRLSAKLYSARVICFFCLQVRNRCLQAGTTASIYIEQILSNCGGKLKEIVDGLGSGKLTLFSRGPLADEGEAP